MIARFFSFAIIATMTPTTYASDFKKATCAISVADVKSIWQVTPGWVELNGNFEDKATEWIGAVPLRGGDIKACAPIGNGKMNVYVSPMDVPANGLHRIEFIADNEGKLQLWKLGDAAKPAVEVAVLESSYAKYVTFLEAGRYLVVIENIDHGVASGAAASIAGLNNTFRKRTSGDGSWLFTTQNSDFRISDLAALDFPMP